MRSPIHTATHSDGDDHVLVVSMLVEHPLLRLVGHRLQSSKNYDGTEADLARVKQAALEEMAEAMSIAIRTDFAQAPELPAGAEEDPQ